MRFLPPSNDLLLFITADHRSRCDPGSCFSTGTKKPVITGTDDGIWSRIALIPYTLQVGDGCELPIDPDLPDKLRGELPAFSRGRFRGYLEWQNKRLKTPPKTVELPRCSIGWRNSAVPL